MGFYEHCASYLYDLLAVTPTASFEIGVDQSSVTAPAGAWLGVGKDCKTTTVCPYTPFNHSGIYRAAAPVCGVVSMGDPCSAQPNEHPQTFVSRWHHRQTCLHSPIRISNIVLHIAKTCFGKLVSPGRLVEYCRCVDPFYPHSSKIRKKGMPVSTLENIRRFDIEVCNAHGVDDSDSAGYVNRNLALSALRLSNAACPMPSTMENTTNPPSCPA